MSENGPIPDELLRAYAEWSDNPVTHLFTGEVVTDHKILHDLLIAIRLTARDMARELLALREAARGVWRADGRRCPDVVAYKSWRTPEMAALIALLPEESQ